MSVLLQGPMPCPGCPGWMTDGSMMAWMWFGAILLILLAIALLVLVAVVIVRLWPGGGTTFRASEPSRRGTAPQQGEGEGDGDG